MIESAYSGIVEYKDSIAWAEEEIAYIEEQYSGECYKEAGKVLFTVMKVALCAKAEDTIYCMFE